MEVIENIEIPKEVFGITVNDLKSYASEFYYAQARILEDELHTNLKCFLIKHYILNLTEKGLGESIHKDIIIVKRVNNYFTIASYLFSKEIKVYNKEDVESVVNFIITMTKKR